MWQIFVEYLLLLALGTATFIRRVKEKSGKKPSSQMAVSQKPREYIQKKVVVSITCFGSPAI